MVFLDMASVNENARRGSTGGRRIVRKAIQLPGLPPDHHSLRHPAQLSVLATTPGAFMSVSFISTRTCCAHWLHLLLACTLAMPTWATAPDPLARARAVYTEVNQGAQRMSTQRFLARVPGVAYTSEVVASVDKGQLRKLAVTDPDDSGNVLTDLYFDSDGALVFALRTTQGYTATGKVKTNNEHRLYFAHNRLVHMLAGMSKAPLAPGDRLAQAEAATTQTMATALRKATLAPPSPTVTVGGQRKLAEGTVMNLENGDSVCYITLVDPAGRVHQELADFALCEVPEKLLNRQVTLSYITSTVMAAACEGNTRCTKTDKVALVTRAVPASTTTNPATRP
jgi:hypothetical protein